MPKGLLFLVDVDENLETEFLTDETRLNQVLQQPALQCDQVHAYRRYHPWGEEDLFHE